MTKEESMSKKINSAFDFVDYLIKNPSEAEKIPGSHIRFIDDNVVAPTAPARAKP